MHLCFDYLRPEVAARAKKKEKHSAGITFVHCKTCLYWSHFTYLQTKRKQQKREVHIEKNSYKRNSLRTIWVKRRCVRDHFRSNEPRYVMRPFVIQSHKKMRLLTSYDVSLFIYFFFNGRQHFNPSNKNHNKREEEQVGKSSDLSGEPLVSTSWKPCPIGSFERWGRVKTKAKIRKACSSLKIPVQLISNHLRHSIFPFSITLESNVKVMTIQEMITNLRSSRLLNKFSFSTSEEIYREKYGEYAYWC